MRSGWDYHYRKHGIYGLLSIPVMLATLLGSYQLFGWVGLAIVIAVLVLLTMRSRGLSFFDGLGQAIWPTTIGFFIIAFAWKFLRQWIGF